MMQSSRTFYLNRAGRRVNPMDYRSKDYPSNDYRNNDYRSHGSLLDTLQQELQSVAAGMSDAQMTWHPQGKWCAAEILEHLCLAFTATSKGFERVLAAGHSLAGNPTLRNRLQTFIVLTFNYLPEGRTAPKQTLPQGLPPQQVKAQTAAAIAAMESILSQCESRLGRGKLLDHPFLGPFTADQWRKFHLLHGRHHAKQIQSLRDRNT